MNIHQVEFFVECCNSGSISAAANKLHITPSGLRLALHRLEEDFGVSLIQWGSPSFALTDDGKFFLENAYLMLGAYENCRTHFSGQQHYETVRVSSSIHFPIEYIGILMADFRLKHPNVNFYVTDSEGEQCDHAVENGIDELGFNTGPFSAELFEYYPILRYSLLAVVNRKNPASALPAFPIQLLETHKVVTAMTKPSDTVLRDTFRQDGVELRIATRCTRESAIFQRANHNPEQIGIIDDEIAAHVNYPELKILPFEDLSITRNVYLFHRKNANLSKAALEFKRYVLKRIREDGAALRGAPTGG